MQHRGIMFGRIGATVVTATIATIAAATTTACSKGPRPDAYGNVEATDIVVGAESTGRVISFEPLEGTALVAGAIVGIIDATDLTLQRQQAVAERDAAAARTEEVERQIAAAEAQRAAAAAQHDAAAASQRALEAQLDIAVRGKARIDRLFEQQAATAQQRDRAERETRVLEEQIEAQQNQVLAARSQIEAQARHVLAIRAQKQALAAQVAAMDARVAQFDERIEKSRIVNRVGGVVLATYVEAGEVVQAGQPLYRIANLDTVDVRAYVAETALASLRAGQAAQVTVDAGAGTRRTLPGTVAAIASQAEFTPTQIQTREERTDLVYAVKIRVPNEGHVLKIGMPVDVRFGPATAP